MNKIKFIRNKWFLVIFSFFYFGIFWGIFQLFYKREILLQHFSKSADPPDDVQVMKLYNKMIHTSPKPQDIHSYYSLGKILIKNKKRKETIKVLNKVIKIKPDDQSVRLWLAIELYNQQRYREAEKHFVVLLKKKNNKELLQKNAEYH